jgi:hypothetical protein
MTELWIVIKGVYGKQILQPKNVNAILFARLANKVTLSVRDLSFAEQLGMVVVLDGSTADKAYIRQQIDAQTARTGRAAGPA